MSNSICITHYDIGTKLNINCAVIADLHDGNFEEIQKAFSEEKPDVILIPGDLSNRHISPVVRDGVKYKEPEHAKEFLKYAVSIAPTFLSRGNNDHRWDVYDFAEIAHIQAILLENNWRRCGKLVIGGIASATYTETGKPKTDWLNEFEQQDGYKMLLCHHPEYYEPYIKAHKIDLVIAGHAHGGQVRIGKQGLYAPGQGILPKYTAGVYDGRLVVSRGLCEIKRLPRINNPPELVYIEL